MTVTILCSYCNTLNPPDSKTCQACGAPLSSPNPPIPPVKQQAQRLHPVSPPPLDPKTLNQVRENSEKIEQVVQQGYYWYGVLWRTLAESFSIAFSAVVLGFIAGSFGWWWLGPLAGVILGAAVGASNKPYWLAATSAPAGVILGALAWLPVWIISTQGVGMLLTASLGGILFAVIGSKKRANNLWENLRPFLGAAGGLFFALGGSLLAQSFIWLISNLK